MSLVGWCNCDHYNLVGQPNLGVNVITSSISIALLSSHMNSSPSSVVAYTATGNTTLLNSVLVTMICTSCLYYIRDSVLYVYNVHLYIMLYCTIGR